MKQVNICGMPLEEWQNEGCIAHFGTGDDGEIGPWATLYDIESSMEGKGYAQSLLKEAKEYYEKQGRRVGGTVALTPAMSHIYKKLGIDEYK